MSSAQAVDTVVKRPMLDLALLLTLSTLWGASYTFIRVGAYLRVPIGVALGVVFLGESLEPREWIGLACVVAGVAAMTIPRRSTATT